LQKVTIPISAIIDRGIEVKINGKLSCSISDSVADISADIDLVPTSFIKRQALKLGFGVGSVKELVVSNILQPLDDQRVLMEYTCTVDDEIIEL
jgi:hypothetical protein